jgi:hypothetical protein
MNVLVIKQCIAQDLPKDMQAQTQKLFKSAGNDCDSHVTNITPRGFNGALSCAGGATKMTIITKSINP